MRPVSRRVMWQMYGTERVVLRSTSYDETVDNVNLKETNKTLCVATTSIMESKLVCHFGTAERF
jgi:hypothetical protein